MYEDNCFITLTYNDENLPKDRNIEKKELQTFFKNLRNHTKKQGIRYYACGEYGDQKGRPHYHACVFNYDFTDKELLRDSQYFRAKNHFSKNNQINALYTSPTLSNIWKKGFHTIGEVTFESAGYVARYIQKKITGPMADDYYKRDYMESGSEKRTPEFALMSRMPGIGYPWIEKYFTDVYPKDFFTINGVKNKPVRYYDDYLKKRDPDLHIKLKEARQKKAIEDEITRLKDKEKHKILTTKSLQRKFENE